jgi:hypothetical protein
MSGSFVKNVIVDNENVEVSSGREGAVGSSFRVVDIIEGNVVIVEKKEVSVDEMVLKVLSVTS